MKNKIFIEYKTMVSGGEPESDERFCNYSDQHTEVIWKKAHREHPGGFPETVEVDFDISELKVIYWVVVRYTTGSTFGTCYGEWEGIGCYNNLEEALKIKESIENNTYETPSGYKAWEGYFESLEHVEINTLVIY